MSASNSIKGIEGLYECCCEGGIFYEWVSSKKDYSAAPMITERQICKAPIWYNDAEALTLTEDNFNPYDEANSTWKLTSFSVGNSEKRLKHRPYKTFNLESDDDLVVVKCKIRPVIAIKQVSSDWRVPGNAAKLYNTWFCLPLFSYKSRHTQEYVIRDQRLDCPHHFYFPPGSAGPGIDEESVGKFTELQFIGERNLMPFKTFSYEKSMSLPVRLTEDAFWSVMGHMAIFLPKIDIDQSTKKWYEAFSAIVKEEIDKSVNVS